jgi:hypothetical protein
MSMVILVVGSVLPSLITIISNIIPLYRLHQFNRAQSTYMTTGQRRTDDSRRVLFVITIECLLAIMNSWFCDIALSFVYCKKMLLIDDDCPMFLQENYEFLVVFDLFNSLSNIVLHCMCSVSFRRELFVVGRSCLRILRHITRPTCSHCCRIDATINENSHYVYRRASITPNSTSPSHIYLDVRLSSRRNTTCIHVQRSCVNRRQR